ILDIAKSSLLASQAGIQTSSHNIANVDTPGYTRQRVSASTGDPVIIGGRPIGTGVFVNGIERSYDRFLGLQIMDAQEKMGRQGALRDTLGRLEGIFNDSAGLGLGDTLDNLFNSLNDVANDPSSYAARSAMLSTASTLAERITSLDRRVGDEIGLIEGEIKGEIEAINTLTTSIGRLNSDIQRTESGGNTANDLRDERDRLLNDLAGRIDVTMFENDSGQVTVLTAGGNPLVADNITTALSVKVENDNGGYNEIYSGNHKITSHISTGSVKGLLDARDTHFIPALETLDTLSASLTKEFNVLHSQGYGLDGSTGLNLFTPLSPTAAAHSGNGGGAAASASVQSLSALTLDEYEIRFTSASSFNIVNRTDGTAVSSGNSYSSGGNIDFDGLRVVISDITGTPQSGDVFSVKSAEGAAQGFGVAITDPDKFAAATSSSALPGDNSNALSMVNLRGGKVLANGNASFSSYYSSLVTDVAVASRAAVVNSDAQAVVMAELESYRESVSGVSIDEEGLNLIRYQHSYEAAAKVMNVVNELFDTLISLR
ncbi:MAG: flagellar hook-associated protein FlgK, partial [Thermodesulfobacteriota bacterium]